MPFEYFINGDYIHLNNLKCGLDPHITWRVYLKENTTQQNSPGTDAVTYEERYP